MFKVEYPVAPDFVSDEARRSWELAFPGLVRRYYCSVAVVAHGRRSVADRLSCVDCAGVCDDGRGVVAQAGCTAGVVHGDAGGDEGERAVEGGDSANEVVLAGVGRGESQVHGLGCGWHEMVHEAGTTRWCCGRVHGSCSFTGETGACSSCSVHAGAERQWGKVCLPSTRNQASVGCKHDADGALFGGVTELGGESGGSGVRAAQVGSRAVASGVVAGAVGSARGSGTSVQEGVDGHSGSGKAPGDRAEGRSGQKAGDVARGSSGVQGEVPPVGLGEDGTGARCVNGVVGPKTALNRAKREAAKRRKIRKQEATRGDPASKVPEWRRGAPGRGVGVREDLGKDEELQKSLRTKWVAENRLAAAKAEQALRVVEARDVEQHVKAERARSLMLTEQRLVAVEKAHATLAATGNVDLGGSAATVVNQGSSISPSSSVSAKAMKELEEEVARLKKLIAKRGVPDVDPALYDKLSWTDNSDNYRLLDEMYDGDYGMNHADAASGRFNLLLPTF